VKAGDNVSVQMMRDLRGTVEREKAKLGILLTLAEPTKPMRAEAAAAGMADLEGVKCPKIQIVTFKDLLDGKQPQLPYADYAFALPKAKEDEGEQGKLL
jgi:site-specific DNA-methyltransferase (adenine-specific)